MVYIRDVTCFGGFLVSLFWLETDVGIFFEVNGC